MSCVPAALVGIWDLWPVWGSPHTSYSFGWALRCRGTQGPIPYLSRGEHGSCLLHGRFVAFPFSHFFFLAFLSFSLVLAPSEPLAGC